MSNLQASRPDAAEILRRIDDPQSTFVQRWLNKHAAVKELIKALRASSNARQKAILCYVLGKRHAKSAYPFILNCLNDPSSDVRNNAAEALDKIGNPAAGETLYAHFLAEADPAAQSSMAMALGGVKYLPAIPTLIDALNDEDWRVRDMAAWSLGFMGTQETIQQLRIVLEQTSDEHLSLLIREIINDISNQEQPPL